MKLSEVDQNFTLPSAELCDNLEVYSVQEPPISTHGVFYEDGKYKRLPLAVAKEVSSGVTVLHSMSAGGRFKFRTDSQTVALFIESEPFAIPHQTLLGSSGFEIYADGIYAKSVFIDFDGKPHFKESEKFSGYIRFDKKKMREITVYMPLYCRVRQVFIGIEKEGKILKSKDYLPDLPIVYYGSSITQGCCASKPSCSYQSFIERWTKRDYINLGFSGNCKGEDRMIDYLASLKMSAFVLDYDYNAPTVEHLQETHEKCYRAIRATHPDIPILMMSRPEAKKTEDSSKRRDTVKATYLRAVESGDEKVRFIDGHTLFGGKDKDACTVDGCHPTDLGFYRMAKRIYKELKTFAAFSNQKCEK